MPVTLKDVAEKAGVSRSAVSRTLWNSGSVSVKMRRKVEKAAEELGFSPNALARSLSTGQTKMIGLVADNFHNPLFLEVFDLFTQGLQARGLRPLLVNLTNESTPADSVRMLKQYSVDGVLLASSTLPPSLAETLREEGLPVVHCFGRKSSTPNLHIVGIDNIACGRLAARTLIERNYRRIAYLGGPESSTSSQDRCFGFLEEAGRQAGVDASHSFADAYTFEAGRREMQRLLRMAPAEAYFCGDDVLSIGALSALAEAGVGVPAEIGIIGLNDMEMSGWSNIDLTTIRQPTPEIIRSSIEIVVSLMEEPDRYPEARMLPCELVERGTLRPKS